VRVIRMPRHGASLPIGLGVSCSADRQVLGKITKDGVYLEELEHNPAKYLPEVEATLGGVTPFQSNGKGTLFVCDILPWHISHISHCIFGQW